MYPRSSWYRHVDQKIDEKNNQMHRLRIDIDTECKSHWHGRQSSKIIFQCDATDMKIFVQTPVWSFAHTMSSDRRNHSSPWSHRRRALSPSTYGKESRSRNIPLRFWISLLCNFRRRHQDVPYLSLRIVCISADLMRLTRAGYSPFPSCTTLRHLQICIVFSSR